MSLPGAWGPLGRDAGPGLAYARPQLSSPSQTLPPCAAQTMPVFPPRFCCCCLGEIQAFFMEEIGDFSYYAVRAVTVAAEGINRP